MKTKTCAARKKVKKDDKAGGLQSGNKRVSKVRSRPNALSIALNTARKRAGGTK